MSTGYNAVIDIYRMRSLVDDVGGSEMTGTLIAQGVRTRLEEVAPSLQLLEQGMETRRLLGLMLPGDTVIRERDEVFLAGPNDHPYYSGTFRTVGVTQDSIGPGDSRRHVWAIAERVSTSRKSV